jgi:chromosome partitioning protein
MTRIIALVNQKGGVGKTTSAINIAAGLARGLKNGKRVLLIDGDPQANTTAVLFGPGPAYVENRQHNTIYEVMMGAADAPSTIQTVKLAKYGNVPEASLDLLPSHIDLCAAEMQLVTMFEREQCLRRAIVPIQDTYQYIIIDCPPSLSQITLAILMTTTEIIIPVELGFFAFAGLTQLLSTIKVVQRSNSSLRIMGVLPTMEPSPMTDLARQVRASLDQKFPGLVLPSIPRRTVIGEAVAAQRDIFGYKPLTHPAVLAYGAVVQEVINRG